MLGYELPTEPCQIFPQDQQIIFLGDGEFDSIELQQYISSIDGWQYVCRTAISTIVHSEGEQFPVGEVAILPDSQLSLLDVLVTQEAFGPVNLVAVWDKKCNEPIYLVTSFELANEAYHWYQRRMCIETFFSDPICCCFFLSAYLSIFAGNAGKLCPGGRTCTRNPITGSAEI